MSYIFKAGHKVRVTLTFADPQRRDAPPPVTILTGGADALGAHPAADPGALMSVTKPAFSPSPEPYRILIQREASTRWELICDGPMLSVERVGATGSERYTLEKFEASEDGKRLSNSLTVALAAALRTPESLPCPPTSRPQPPRHPA